MWEFRNRNVFGATAFSTYGGFWIGARPVGAARRSDGEPRPVNDLGWILLAFAIFNTYMLIWSTQLNMAVFGVFLTLELTEIILFIGELHRSHALPDQLGDQDRRHTSASSRRWSPGTHRRPG